MHVQKLITAATVLFIFIFGADYLVHNIWLRTDYDASPHGLWRPDPEMYDRAPWIMAGQALAAMVFVWVWAAGFAAGATVRRAVLFGLFMGLFRQADRLMSYAVHPYSGTLVVKSFLVCTGIAVVMGLLVHWIYKPLPAGSDAAKPGMAKRIGPAATAACLVVLFGWLLFSWSNFQKIEPTADWMSSLKTTWVVDSPRLPHSVQTSSEIQKNGTDSLRFELRGGDAFSDGLGRKTYRAEVDIKDFPPMRSVRWYAFSMFLPEDMPREDNWLVLAQWHGVDKRHLGEPSRIPVMAFVYNDGTLRVVLRHSDKRVLEYEEDSAKVELFETNELPLGQWNDFIVQAKWSYEADGFVNIWMNGAQIVNYRGPVGYNDDVGPYFRFGLYRGRTQQTYIAGSAMFDQDPIRKRSA